MFSSRCLKYLYIIVVFVRGALEFGGFFGPFFGIFVIGSADDGAQSKAYDFSYFSYGTDDIECFIELCAVFVKHTCEDIEVAFEWMNFGDFRENAQLIVDGKLVSVVDFYLENIFHGVDGWFWWEAVGFFPVGFGFFRVLFQT